MRSRAQQKHASLNRILDVASVRLCEQGLDGAAIASVMQEAGLTHGAFYAHFANKDELARAAFLHAINTRQPAWFGKTRQRRVNESFPARLKRLASSYLKRSHRDNIGAGCAISALATQVSKATPEFRQTFEQVLTATLIEISGPTDANASDAEDFDTAIAFLALCVGGLTLARGVTDPALSDRILSACRTAVDRLAAAED